MIKLKTFLKKNTISPLQKNFTNINNYKLTNFPIRKTYSHIYNKNTKRFFSTNNKEQKDNTINNKQEEENDQDDTKDKDKGRILI